LKIKEAITKAAEESIGYKKWKNRKWLRTCNEEIQRAIEEKKAGYRKYLQNKTVDYYIEYKRHRAILRKMTRSQRKDDWDKFVKTLERNIIGTQRRGFKIFKQLQMQERDKIKIDPITKTEWKEYCGKLWNDQGSKGEEGIEEEKRSEGTDDNEDMITIDELNEVLKHAKNRKSCGLDNLPMELWKFGGNELKIHLLELFNKIIDKNRMPQEWETGMTINIHKKEQKANGKIIEELLYCLQLTNYLQT